jgi:hypothetical protein
VERTTALLLVHGLLTCEAASEPLQLEQAH